MPSLRPDKWVEKLGELTGLSANDIAGALPSAEQLAGVNKALASFKLGDLAEQGVNRLVGHPTRAGDYMQTLGNLIHAGNLPLRLMQTQFAAPEYGQRLAGWALADPTRERPKGDQPPSDAGAAPVTGHPGSPSKSYDPEWFAQITDAERSAAYTHPEMAANVVAKRNGIDVRSEFFKQLLADAEPVSRDFFNAAYQQTGAYPTPEQYYAFLQGYLDTLLQAQPGAPAFPTPPHEE